MEGTQGKTVDERTKLDAMEERCCLACSAFFPYHQESLPAMAPTVGRALSHQPLVKKISYRLIYMPIL